jgi:hypothetical protein
MEDVSIAGQEEKKSTTWNGWVGSVCKEPWHVAHKRSVMTPGMRLRKTRFSMLPWPDSRRYGWLAVWLHYTLPYESN